MNGLMIASAFVLPYHVMRTAAAAGVRVHVLGNGPSRALRTSRFCASYRALGADATDNEAGMLDAIRQVVRRRRIKVIFAADDVSTRLLAGLGDRLPTRVMSLPDVKTFDLLNDKWNFTRFCRDIGARVPQGWCFETVDGLRTALRAGEIELPITLKPTARSGGVGVVHIRDDSEIALLDRIDYRPILVQRHIFGEEISLSAICRHGVILAHTVHRRTARRFQLFSEPDLLETARRVIAAARYNGPVNFDAVREDGTGASYIVECNPRFWFSIFLQMITGINFFAATLAGDAETPVPATMISDMVDLSLRQALTQFRSASALERRLARYHLSDPIPYLLNWARLVDDSEVAVHADQIHVYVEPNPVVASVPSRWALFASRS
ncbi:MAG TPA: ATP-grasp domain-containing protein [Stellaceae bacterium]|nr:ATP-grasp domain-containing protein [Stellaceae bacterium]